MDGTRYLHLSGGNMIALTQDGLETVGELSKVYDGWQYPKEWNVEGFYLEAPKITFLKGYYYMTSAQGGTAGPATSHMVISARSKTPWGPWENSPYNPIVHTKNTQERWWSKGHGSLVDTPEGDWWMLYHAYEKGYHTLGRQTLMEPIEWTKDGWYRIAVGSNPEKPIQKPMIKELKKQFEEQLENQMGIHEEITMSYRSHSQASMQKGLTLSDNFQLAELGLQWRFFESFDHAHYQIKDGILRIKATGDAPSSGRILSCIPMNHSYTAQVGVLVERSTEGGLLLFYNQKCFCGIGLDEKFLRIYRAGLLIRSIPYASDKIYFRILNDCHEVSLYYSSDAVKWEKTEHAMEVSGYHHNVHEGFISLRVALYAAGQGNVGFKDFVYLSR